MSTIILKASHDGELIIGDTIISCAVLEDGTRLITQRSFLSAIGRAKNPKGGQSAGTDASVAFLAANNLKPFITKELEEATRPLKFRLPKGTVAFGYKAEILPQVCEVYLKARDEKALQHTQSHIAEKADILMRGLAHIGIIALVDEATGYQEVRDRLALQKILDKYITDEWAKWTKVFPDEFYKQLFRLKNVPYPPLSMKGRKPSYVGHWTNEIVYSRLAPGVLKELKEKAPRRPSGSRIRKFHQHLTRDFGNPELRDLLSNVIFLMKSCTTWNDFKRRLNRSQPKYGDTMPLDLGDE